MGRWSGAKPHHPAEANRATALIMPMLYALGQHGGLEEAQQRLPGSGALVGSLGDIYWCTRRGHARESFDIATSSVRRHCGVDVNMGKCRAWCRAGGTAPDGIREFGEEVRKGDNHIVDLLLEVVLLSSKDDENFFY